MQKKLGIDFRRKCSCGSMLSTRKTMCEHRRRGHEIPLARYDIKTGKRIG